MISKTSACGTISGARSACRKNGISSAFNVAGSFSRTRKPRLRRFNSFRNGTKAPTTTVRSSAPMSLASNASTPRGGFRPSGVRAAARGELGERVDRRNADAAADAMVGERLLDCVARRLALHLAGERHRHRRRGTAQHTASGIVLIGVTQAPALPVLSLTPVKNRPMTARSIVISSSSAPRMVSMVAIVSSRMVAATVRVLCVVRNGFSITGKR